MLFRASTTGGFTEVAGTERSQRGEPDAEARLATRAFVVSVPVTVMPPNGKELPNMPVSRTLSSRNHCDPSNNERASTGGRVVLRSPARLAERREAVQDGGPRRDARDEDCPWSPRRARDTHRPDSVPRGETNDGPGSRQARDEDIELPFGHHDARRVEGHRTCESGDIDVVARIRPEPNPSGSSQDSERRSPAAIERFPWR